MNKHAKAGRGRSTGAGVASAPAVAFAPIQQCELGCAGIEHEEIARLAYSYWEARGCPIGSPEEDWLRAEMELLRADLKLTQGNGGKSLP